MANFRVEIKGGKKGKASDHGDYIARKGFHRRRGDLIHAEHGNLPDWAGDDPRVLWKAADKYERANGSAYREVVISLPNELTAEQNVALVADVVAKLALGKPYQAAIHATTSSLEGEPNPHVHLMTCERGEDGIDRSPERMFCRYNSKNPGIGGRKKLSGGRTSTQLKDEVIAIRKDIADTINRHLEMNGCLGRVDHRSLRKRGLRREGERPLGQARIRSMSPEEKATWIAMRRANVSASE